VHDLQGGSANPGSSLLANFEIRAYIAITQYTSHGHAALEEMIVVDAFLLPGLAPFAWFLFQNSSVHHVVDEVVEGKY